MSLLQCRLLFEAWLGQPSAWFFPVCQSAYSNAELFFEAWATQSVLVLPGCESLMSSRAFLGACMHGLFFLGRPTMPNTHLGVLVAEQKMVILGEGLQERWDP